MKQEIKNDSEKSLLDCDWVVKNFSKDEVSKLKNKLVKQYKLGGFMQYQLLEFRTWMIDEDCGVYEMLQELPAVDEFEQHNEYNGMCKQEVKEKISEMMRYAYGFDNNEDHPKCENFILFADGKPVVIGGLMLEMTDFWRKYRGHIWYKTRPSERKKGYCSQFTKMLCERAKELGMKEVISQCDVNNIGSNKVLLNNGFEKYKNTLCLDWDDTNFYKKTLT